MKIKENQYYFSDDEYYDISLRLEDCHSIFVQLWNNSRPLFSTSISTAAVVFDSEGSCLSFLINYEFWKKQSFEQKVFIIAHECFHIALGHGIRFTNKKKTNEELKAANMAMDVVVNHKLLSILEIERKVIDPENIYCWIDTVFKPNTVEENMHFEYYYLKMMNDSESLQNGGSANGQGNQILDDHSGLNSISDKDYEKLMKDILDQMSNSEKIDTKDLLEDCCGQSAGGPTGKILQQLMKEIKVEKKAKWETIIQNWARKSIKYSEKEEETWIKPNRRFALLDQETMFLPGVIDVEKINQENNKIEVWFFLDTSGSCTSLAPRFWKAANTLPEERFDLKLFCFDTSVYPTDLKTRRLFGFGGTTFSCINNYVNNHSKEKYPDAVFVLTDGYGNSIQPRVPESWYWFLTTTYTSCIPKTCNIFSLGDFE